MGAFLSRFGTEIDAMHEALRGFLGQALGDFGRTVYDSVLDMSEDWEEPVRRELLARYTGFPLWDVVIFPLQAVADVGELNRVEVVRFSPEDVGILKVRGQKGERPTAKEKLRGVPLGHFAAFFGRDRRENDYLWGRLDGVERLVGLLLLGDAAPEISKPAFKAILDEEEPRLTKVGDVFGDLRSQLAQ